MVQWVESTTTETYWTTCYTRFGIPYPCQRTRTVTVRKFCYHFTHMEGFCVGLRARATACEGSDKYQWWEWCFGVSNSIGDDALLCTPEHPCEKCYDKEKPRVGNC